MAMAGKRGVVYKRASMSGLLSVLILANVTAFVIKGGQGLFMGEEPGLQHLADEKGMVSRLEHGFYPALQVSETVFQNRTARFSFRPYEIGEFGFGIGPFETTEKILLILIEEMKTEGAAFLDQAVGKAVGVNRDHDKGRVIGDLRHPGSDHPVDCFPVARGEHIDAIGHTPKGLEPPLIHGFSLHAFLAGRISELPFSPARHSAHFPCVPCVL